MHIRVCRFEIIAAAEPDNIIWNASTWSCMNSRLRPLPIMDTIFTSETFPKVSYITDKNLNQS